VKRRNGLARQLLNISFLFLLSGLDGYIRIWSYASLENELDDERLLQMEPLFELVVREGDISAKIISLVKASCVPSDTLWLAQVNPSYLYIINLILKAVLTARTSKSPDFKLFSIFTRYFLFSIGYWRGNLESSCDPKCSNGACAETSGGPFRRHCGS